MTIFIRTTFESIFDGIKKHDQSMSNFCRLQTCDSSEYFTTGMLLKIVFFLSLFLSKQQQTIFLNSFLNSLSKLQYIVIFMLEFRTANISATALVRSVLGTKESMQTKMIWQQKNKPTIAKTFLTSCCSTLLETGPFVSSSIFLLVYLTLYKRKIYQARPLLL